MAWNVETVRSDQATSSYTAKTISERKSARSQRQTSSTMGEYSIVGINANEVANMKIAVEKYVAAIQDHLKDLDEKVSTAGAFKSAAVDKAVKAYLLTLQEYCQNLASQMLAFRNKLQDVANKWVEATESMAQSINSSASGFNKGTNFDQQSDK